MKKIRGKSLQEWKKYSDKDLRNIPIRTRKYIFILEELVEPLILNSVSIKDKHKTGLEKYIEDYFIKLENIYFDNNSGNRYSLNEIIIEYKLREN